jgi:hypothetical protein
MRGWVCGDIEMNNLALMMAKDNQEYNILNPTVGTTKKSIDSMSFA